MTLNNFIFSNQLKHRLARHLVLWILFSVYFFVVNFFPRNEQDFFILKTYTDALGRMIYLPVSIISVYISIYFLLPRFIIKGKYFKFIILFLCLCATNLVAAYLLTRLWVQVTQSVPFQQLPIQIRIFQPVIYGLGLGLAASGFATIIKLLKVRYLKQKENEQLLQQKIATELQTIKTNFHPHFLSNALQNISGLIRNRSKQSPEVILKLSDLLSFILYESEARRIPLEQELKMMKDYLELEKIFYSDRISVSLREQGDISGKNIAPLILLSLVQNCCEQSLISLQQKLILDIKIKTETDKFIFQLGCNGYYENINGTPQKNTGLSQALRRIKMIYRDKHQLETHAENGYFYMTLVLEAETVYQDEKKKKEAEPLYEPV